MRNTEPHSNRSSRPGVRRSAVQLLPRGEAGLAALLESKLLDDPNAQVRLQSLLTLAEMGHGDRLAVVDRNFPAYAGRLPLEQVADTLARAAGHWGSSAQYLFRTVSKLEESGIRDRNLWRIQDLVARQIIASTGGAQHARSSP